MTLAEGAISRRAEIGAERRSRTRNALLVAAFDELGHEGGASFRIDDICVKAKVSRANFYNYFSDSRELLDALTYELSHDFNTAMLTTIQAMTRSIDRTSAAIRFHINRAIDDPCWGWAMVHISAGGPILGAESYQQATKTLLEGKSSGELTSCPVPIALDLILGGTLAAMIRVLHEKPSSSYPEDVALHILLGLGVPFEEAARISTMPLPNPMDLLPQSAR